jgi:hypothetical protein
MRSRSSWRLVIVGLGLIVMALLVRLYAGPLKSWLISMHGGPPSGH